MYEHFLSLVSKEVKKLNKSWWEKRIYILQIDSQSYNTNERLQCELHFSSE